MKFVPLVIAALQISAVSSTRSGVDPGIRGDKVGPDAALSVEQIAAQKAMISGEVTKSDVEIVMALCNEDASWAVPFEDFITVYSQCPGEGKSPSDAVENVLLSNVGKESHAYLEHIVRNYERLADWTVFTQAGFPSEGYANGKPGGGDHDGGHMVHGSLFEDYVLAYASGLPHYFVASSAVDPNSLSHNIRLDYKVNSAKVMPAERGTWGIKDRCLPADSPLWMEKFIQMDPDNFEPLIAQKRTCGTECPSLIEFATQLGVPGLFVDGEPIVFSQGARFAVSKERLLHHPKSYYQDLLHQVSLEIDPWQGYFFEYLWYHMLAAADNEDRMCEEAPFHGADQVYSSRDLLSRGLSGVSGVSTTTTTSSTSSTTCCEYCCTCECHNKKEELTAEIEELDQHIAALEAAMEFMDEQIAALRDVTDAQLELSENFEVKIIGRCVLGGLDGLAVGKLIQVFKPLCVQGAFAAACVKAGAATTKEAIEYTLKQANLQAAIIAWASKSASIVAKATVQDSGWIKYIPIIGGACEAYNWSEAVMNSADVIAMVGDQIIEAMEIKNQMRTLKKEKEATRDEKQAELDALGDCGDCDEEE